MEDKKLAKVAALQLADAEAAESERLRVTPRRRWRRWFWRRLRVWTDHLSHVARWMKIVGAIAAGAPTLFGGVRLVVKAGVKFVQLYRARADSEPGLPPATGVASTTVDRVEKPTPPKP